MNFTPSEKKTLDKYLSPDLLIRLDALSSVELTEKIKVTNTGMVSSGKSSLFNILIDSHSEYFKTGAARTTTSADTFDMEHCHFVDTPGIDVNQQDDALAYKTIMSSDLILMIHNIKTGPLQRKEMEWLEQIVSHISDPEAIKKRLIFVLSWKDTREKEADYEDMVLSIKEMVYSLTKVEIPFFEVSVKKWNAGVDKNSDKLKASSNIQQLKQYITDYVQQYQKDRVHLHHASCSALVNECKKELSTEKNRINKEMDNNKAKIEKVYKGKQTVWNNMYQYYNEQQEEIWAL